MNCSQVQHWISADSDGVADAARRPAVDAHVAGCDACRAFAEGLAGLNQTLAAFAAPEPSTGFAQRTQNRLDRSKIRWAWPQFRPDLLRPLPVGVAVAAFAFGVALTWMANGTSSSPSTSTISAASQTIDDPLSAMADGSAAPTDTATFDNAMLALLIGEEA